MPKTEPPAVIESDISVALNRCVKTTSASLEFKTQPTYEEWEQIITFQLGIRERSLWWIGDALNYGEATYGEKYAQAIRVTGNEYSTLANTAYVCRKFEITRRRERLSFGHHEACAGLLPQEADRILKQAEIENWNRQDVRDAVARANGLSTKADKENAAKMDAKRTSRAPRKPPTIDVQAHVSPTDQKPAKQIASTPEDTAEWHLGAFNEAAARIDWTGMKPLARKTWMKRLEPADRIIESLASESGRASDYTGKEPQNAE